MTRNRKADLQRKLAMAPVATPPDGLADRIKGDIPNLRFEAERARANLRQSTTFNLRIAASIVLLVSSLYFMVHLISRTKDTPAAMSADRTASSVPRQTAVTLPRVPPQPGSGRAQQSADLPSLPSTPPEGFAASQPRQQIAEKKREEANGMNAGAPAYVDTVEQQVAVAQPAPIGLAPEPSPAPVAEARRVNEAAEERSTTMAKTIAPQSAGSTAASAFAPVPAPPPPPTAAAAPTPSRARDAAAPHVRNFSAIEESIARGETPRNGDVATIVRHFSAPATVPSNIRIELEASATPLDSSRWLLRVSVDAPAGTRPDVAVTFGDAIASHRLVTGSPGANETAMYEIEFKRYATSSAAIATVRVAGLEPETLHASELRSWSSASQRMKRASLAAAWAHTLQSRTHADAIVAKAREEHIDDLADLAEKVERNQ